MAWILLEKYQYLGHINRPFVIFKVTIIVSTHHKNPKKPQQAGFAFKAILLILLVATFVALAIYIISLNKTILSTFESRRWDLPAKLYSRPLVLYQNAGISPSDLDAWLKLLNYKQGGYDKTGSYEKKGNLYTIHTRGFEYGEQETDAEQLIEVRFDEQKIVSIRSTQASKDGTVRLEPVYIGGIYPTNNEDRLLLKPNQAPKQLIDALIATEDRGFYEHHGLSVRGISRALVSNISGKSTQGGSTITQQLVKNFYLNSERTLKRKFNEAIMALLLELHYSKETILLAYLNEINLGQNGNLSINGFGIASEFYFDKPLNELSLDQYALLVGIAKGPSYYNPRKHPERALERRNLVLHNMVVTGMIDQESYQKASQKPLNVVSKPTITKSRFPDFLDTVQRELNSYYKKEDLQSQGLKIISTLDPLAQAAANQAMSKKLSEFHKKGGKTKNLQGALVSAHPATGELLAVVGSGSEFTGFNRALDAKRQVGSLLKPVIYLTAFQSGRYNLATPVNDSQISYDIGSGKNWTPKNYSGGSHGHVPAIQALSNSYNQAAVNLGMEFGMNAFIAQMQNLSVTQSIPTYPSTLLGAIDLSPMNVLGIYQIISNGGAYTPIHSVKLVIDENNKVLQRSQPIQQFRAPPEAVYLLNRGLQEVIKSGTAKSANSINKDLNLAGKTGTTNNHRDAWFAGYSGNYVSVVWVGRDDNKPIGLSGGNGALPIWTDYMKRLTLSPVNLPQPIGVSWEWLDSKTGLPTQSYCPNATWLPIITAYRPTQSSSCFFDYQPIDIFLDQIGNGFIDHDTGSYDDSGYEADLTPADNPFDDASVW